MDLESRNSQLLEELSTSRLNPASTRNSIDWLPRAPPRHTLTGHRSPVTRVAFHPLYSVCASTSEDASIKVWDWETGELERTLKGHTKAVQDCDYDSKGLLLGKSLQSLKREHIRLMNNHLSVMFIRSDDTTVGRVQ